MWLSRRVSVWTLCLIAAVGRVGAQEPHHHAAAGPEHLGRVHFATTCRAAGQRHFERGVSYLHSFWYEKATPAFRAAVAADSACAMGYWGQAMSLLHPLWTPPPPADLATGLAAAERGLALATTPRERDYLQAIDTYYANYSTTDHATRIASYALAMDSVRHRNPDDHEAAIFYSLALIAVGQTHPTDTTFTYQKRADSILEPLFRLEPEHPGLAHYIIHTNDVPQLASRALFAARRYAAIAPDAPHAQHMPSHIFTRLGLWDEDIASNLKAAAAARAFEIDQHLDAMWGERGHALDYLVYAYLQEGRDAAAREVVGTLAGVTKAYPAGALNVEYAAAAIPARYALERGRWSEAAQLQVRPAPEWPAAEAITHFARALGAARADDTTAARAELAALERIETDLKAAGGLRAYWAGQVEIQRLAVAAWLARAEGDTALGVQQAMTAADREDLAQKHPVTPGPVLPARELLGDLLLACGRPAQAAGAYAASLRRNPRRGRSVFGLARASEVSGDLVTARATYREFLTLMAQSDRRRPEIDMANRFLAAR
jgi:hypothetical protein